MSLRIGDIAPNFQQQSTEGSIDLYQWMGDHWAILLSHPKDFTPVCTTELGEVARLKPEWDKRNIKVIGLSVDSLQSHQEWAKDICETQRCNLNFPILADSDRKVSKLYDMIHPNSDDNYTIRSVFVIDQTKRIRLIISYPPSTGRNFQEILRAIDSLQLTDQYKVVTPANWKNGEDVIISPQLKDEKELEKMFPLGYRTMKPYLRMTSDPRMNKRSG